MRGLKLQYFLFYAMMGSLLPFFAIHLNHAQGLTEARIGYIFGAASAAVLFTPVIMTLLADTRFSPFRLAAAMFSINGLALTLLYFADGFWRILILFCVHGLANAALIPLHDGIVFSVQRRQTADGLLSTPYHQIRLWGTIGFIVPSLILFWFLHRGGHTSIILICAVFFSTLALLNALRFPEIRLRDQQAQPIRSGLPTGMAARALLQPHLRVFCIALFLAYMASSAFSSFYPLYMVEKVGVGPQWVGLIFNFGVALEILFIIGFARIYRRLGLQRMLALGIACLSLQAILLAFSPTVLTAIAIQSLHGLVILAIFIAPVMYINRQADDEFRNSIQGLYRMAVMGAGRIFGVVIAGQIAQVNLQWILLFSAGLAIAAAMLIALAFRIENDLATEEFIHGLHRPAGGGQ